MLNRQKIVLRLLHGCGGRTSRLHVTKWLFLLGTKTSSQGGSAFYQFVPYKYGPYSFSLFREVDQLVRDGLVDEQDDGTWALTEVGHRHAMHLRPDIERDLGGVLDQYRHLTARELIDLVYRQHPWFSVLSDLPGRRALDRPVAPLAVYTTGYEGVLVEGLMDRLLRAGIERIIDVRNNPISRRYGFHRSSLARIAQSLGIDYRPFPELGIPSSQRADVGDRNGVEALLRSYVADTLPHQGASLGRLAGVLQESPAVLLCKEADPTMCHRLPLANAVAPLADLPIVHLGVAECPTPTRQPGS
ncbi:MAG: DUF488 domain-containing protein [Chloroflexota bacterium]|nr:DUF488 domain-containing protein [Chloroflexota bacterium]